MSWGGLLYIFKSASPPAQNSESIGQINKSLQGENKLVNISFLMILVMAFLAAYDYLWFYVLWLLYDFIEPIFKSL